MAPDHLTALARLYTGDFERAQETLAIARPEESGCSLVAVPLPDSPPPETWGPDRPLLVQFVGRARYADACLASCGPGAALAAMQREAFATCGEVQVLARLRAAWLPTPATDRRARFRKITALSRFVAAHMEKIPTHRRALLVLGTTWDEAQLDEVAARAGAWLEGEGVHAPRSPTRRGRARRDRAPASRHSPPLPLPPRRRTTRPHNAGASRIADARGCCPYAELRTDAAPRPAVRLVAGRAGRS